VVSVTSDIVSNVSFQNARSNSSRDDQRSDADSFGSLVDGNTVASTNSDRAAAAQPDLPAPARRDDTRSSSNDRTRQSDDRTDNAAANARDRDTQAADAAQDSRKAKKSDPSDTKADSKADAKTGDKTDTKDASSKDADKTATTDADATAPTEKPVAVAAVAVAIPVPAATTDVTVAPTAPETTGVAQPLAIAAAVLKAQTAVTEAATVDAEAAPASTAPEAEANFAALIASATPAGGKAGAKKTSAADATTASTAEVKSEDKTKTTEIASAQPADAAAASTVGKDAKPGDKLVDGVATDATAVAPEATKPAASAGHERRAEHTAQAAVPDVTAPTTNSLQQQPLQTAPTPIAAATPQLTATVATNAPVPLDGVAVEIVQNAKSGKSSFDIRLDPAELGRIDVRLEVDKHGNVTSHLTVEKPETLTMLRQDAPQLQRALEQAGLKTNDSGLQFSLRDQSQGQQQNSGENSGRNAQRLVIHEDESVPAIAAGRGYGRMLGSSSGVDISI
jgi:chemotaxis protein MotD